MSKAFINEDAAAADIDDESEDDSLLPAGQKNYMTPAGFAALQSELRSLTNDERPKVVEIVSWAAGNGDRSENGDYIYGKKRLREIDRRIRYLIKRLENAEVVDPKLQKNLDRVFFGATVTYIKSDDTPADSAAKKYTVKIVGVDETDSSAQKISWLSPVARALMKAQVGDTVNVRMPGGIEELEVLSIRYDA